MTKGTKKTRQWSLMIQLARHVVLSKVCHSKHFQWKPSLLIHSADSVMDSRNYRFHTTNFNYWLEWGSLMTPVFFACFWKWGRRTVVCGINDHYRKLLRVASGSHIESSDWTGDHYFHLKIVLLPESDGRTYDKSRGCGSVEWIKKARLLRRSQFSAFSSFSTRWTLVKVKGEGKKYKIPSPVSFFPPVGGESLTVKHLTSVFNLIQIELSAISFSNCSHGKKQ